MQLAAWLGQHGLLQWVADNHEPRCHLAQDRGTPQCHLQPQFTRNQLCPLKLLSTYARSTARHASRNSSCSVVMAPAGGTACQVLSATAAAQQNGITACRMQQPHQHLMLSGASGGVQMTEGRIRVGCESWGTAKPGRDTPAVVLTAVRGRGLHHHCLLSLLPACSICEQRMWAKMLHECSIEFATACGT